MNATEPDNSISTPPNLLVVEYRSVDDLREHPQASIIPDMTGEEWAALLEDVRVRGVLEPLRILPDGTVIDGRCRLRAAREAGRRTVPCMIIELAAGEDPVDLMVRTAVLRRHLTVAQRATIALGLKTYHEARAAAAARKTAGRAPTYGDADTSGGNLRADLPEGPPKRPRDLAADAVGLSPRTVQDAATVEAEAPDLVGEMKAGRRSVHGAIAEVKRRRRRAATGTTPATRRKAPSLPDSKRIMGNLERALDLLDDALETAVESHSTLIASVGKTERRRVAKRLGDAAGKMRRLAKTFGA